MSRDPSGGTARDAAVACARQIFYRPEAVVDELIASFRSPSGDVEVDPTTVARACFQRPIRMAATLEVFGLRPLHWPMLNLLDAAERDRRAFAEAMVAATSATVAMATQ